MAVISFSEQIPAQVSHASADDPAVPRKQPQQAEGERRLAAAALTHQAQHLPFAQGEIDVDDGPHHRQIDLLKLDCEAFDLQYDRMRRVAHRTACAGG